MAEVKKLRPALRAQPEFIPETQKALACRRVRFTFFDEYEYALERGGMQAEDLDLVLAGDLLMFVERVREYSKDNETLTEREMIDILNSCIDEDILAEFLGRYGTTAVPRAVPDFAEFPCIRCFFII